MGIEYVCMCILSETFWRDAKLEFSKEEAEAADIRV